jgi:GTP-binding protein
MEIKSEFLSSFSTVNSIPKDPRFVQVAFCGRSNAGKSSLINSILNKKEIAKVSSNPGKTKLLNFFILNGKIHLVDLPGFGYANASYKERDEMIVMVNDYLNNSKLLKMLFVLCDSARILPEEEKDIIEICFDKKIIPILVRTKIDKLNQSEKAKLKNETKQNLLDFPKLEIIPTSNKSKEGIDRIREIILSQFI